MLKNVFKNSFVSFVCFVMMMILTVAIVHAESKTYITYYKFACSTTSRKHEASATPIATVKTSNMEGNPSDKLWIELQKKYIYGWSAPGSGKSWKQVSSVNGTTSYLYGQGKGNYRILFGKSSMLLSGNYNSKSDKWYADVKIKYSN